MSELYILKKWFDKPTNILDLLKRKNLRYMQIGSDDAIVIWKPMNKECILWIHNSWGDSLEASVKIKVFLWNPFMAVRSNKIDIEDKLGDLFEREILSER